MSHFSKEMIDTYDKIAPHFSATHHDPIFWQRQFTRFAKMMRGGQKVLDIGCGAGRDAVLFVKKFHYTGIDASAGMLHQARGRVKGGRFLLMDFYNLTFPPQTFDGFWASASLLHIPKWRVGKVLRAIKKILKPDGVGFISLKQRQTISEGIVEDHKYGEPIRRYFSFYTKNEFKNILEANGFSVVHVEAQKEGNTNWLCYFVRR